jgi:predicted GH43/DUF377 family glycosyl hydrolase
MLVNDNPSPLDARPASVTVTRVSGEPVVAAGAVPGYGAIFNAGVIHHDGRFHLFARGVRDGYRRNTGAGARFLDYISDVLVFASTDGRRYEFEQLLAAGSADGVYSYEDPRVQRVRDGECERFVMTYTNLPAPVSGRPWAIGVHRLVYVDGRFQLNHTSGRVVGPTDHPDKDAVVFNLRDGRVAMIHRIHPNMQLALFESLDHLWDATAGYWADHMRELDRHTLLVPTDGALGIGAGAPPVATDEGLLLFFHERGRHGHYTLNVALLDDETGRVKAVLPDPIMRPALEWEREGDVDNVVFVQGAVPQPDGTIYLTYGAADRHVGAALVDTAELLTALRAA